MNLELRQLPEPKSRVVIEAIQEISSDVEIQHMFKMTQEQLEYYLKLVEITDTGIDLSPNFQSPGWGENIDQYPDVNLSNFGTNKNVIKHELKHALHCFSCIRLFADPEYSLQALQLFKLVLVTDTDFIEWIKDKVNEFGQDNIQKALEFVQSPFDLEQTRRMAIVLGSITYQHAYFVDAARCEALASFNDAGAFLTFSHFLNRTVGLLVPGSQPLEGYNNSGMQDQLMQADPLTLSLLTPKHSYDPDTYWDFSSQNLQ